MSSGAQNPDVFIDRWSKAAASERANAQLFLAELADLLDVPRPGTDHAEGYSVEFPVKIPTGPDTHTEGRVDLYRRASFVLEAKQFAAVKAEPTELALALDPGAGKRKSGPVRGSEAWDDAMWKARGQAERYARNLPADEPPAPFLLVVDVGHSIEVFADFTQAGRSYQAFPDPRSFRIRLADLRDEKVRERLRRIWLDPLSLDPAKVSAAVTREIAGYLAVLAASLEKAGHTPKLTAEFLTRCLFCMFAEDVGLLPKDGFKRLLESLRDSPEGFVPKLRTLFAEMQTGTDFSVILNRKLLRFNGGLFEDASVLPLDATQLGILIKAAQMQWKDVEPAIFGTLLERALDPEERHQLGAHYTPRSYVERLVLPTVIEPLRAEWESVRAAALVHAQKGALPKARAEITRFHDQLCEVTVLDPACGSGNFLYVTLEHLKRLEGEVLDVAAGFGENLLLDLATHSVDPHQFLGIELNPRAASLAELVLWIGYLQWHFRTRGDSMPAEPVLKKFRNIECRDAVLAWDGDPQPARDERGEIVTVWDRRSQKTNLVTGRDVPDETKRVPLLTYPNARPAAWPKADYIVGNPPFIGGWMLRQSAGDGYVEALWKAYPHVPEKADYVMYWWDRGAERVRNGELRRFGFITTNSITQVFQRRVIQRHLDASPALQIAFAIPDHPWVDTADGAAVRIAMTVGCAQGSATGVLLEVADEDGEQVTLREPKSSATINADLTIGSDVTKAVPLKANDGICSPGVQLYGDGFIVTEEEATVLRASSPESPQIVRRYINGRDFLQESRNVFVIDFFGYDEAAARRVHPAAFQRVLTHVKPERDQNRRESIRRLWWRFGWERPGWRTAAAGLKRFITTAETAKHRIFAFLDADILPDNRLTNFAVDDAFILGVLSSRTHVVWALAAGGTLEDRPIYTKTTCFDPFPFPACDEAAKARIRALGEELDAHRKRVQAQHPGLSLTAMYNVLEALRAGRALTAREQATHDAGLVSVLRQLHDELDAAVATAYGWPANLSDAEILTRLVALNAERAAEEAAGNIRWLRPDYQAPAGATTQGALGITTTDAKGAKVKPSKTKAPWPKSLSERVQAVERALQASATPITSEMLAKRFLRAKPEDLAEILETLATLGRAHRVGEAFAP